MLNKAYKTMKKELIYKTELNQDALQEAYILALNLEFKDENHALYTLRKIAKCQFVNMVKANEKMENRARDWRAGTNNDELYLDFQTDARALLTDKQREIVNYILSGFKPVEIAEILQVSKAAISKVLSSATDKLKLNYDLLEAGLFEGNKGYFSESDLIYFMDNSETLQKQWGIV